MKNKDTLCMLLLIIPIFLASATWSQSKVYQGTMTYKYKIKNVNEFPEYQNESNTQKIIEKIDDQTYIAENTATLSLLKTNVSFPFDYSKNGGTEVTQALDLSTYSDFEKAELKKIVAPFLSGKNTQHEVIESVMMGIREKVTYSSGASKNPLDVWRTGRAYCVGYAQMAISLLRLIGIPSREVVCYIPPNKGWGSGGQGNYRGGAGGWHSYVEIYYQDAKWISYDPQNSTHFADPYHIVLDQSMVKGSQPQVQDLETKDERNIIGIVEGASNHPLNLRNIESRTFSSTAIIGSLIDLDGNPLGSAKGRNTIVYYAPIDANQYKGEEVNEYGEFAILFKPDSGMYKIFLMTPGIYWEMIYDSANKGLTRKTIDLRDGKVVNFEPQKQTRVYLFFDIVLEERRSSSKLQTLFTDTMGRLSFLFPEEKKIAINDQNNLKTSRVLSIPEKEIQFKNLPELK